MAADCKSAAPCELRRFESSPVHQSFERLGWRDECGSQVEGRIGNPAGADGAGMVHDRSGKSAAGHAADPGNVSVSGGDPLGAFAVR